VVLNRKEGVKKLPGGREQRPKTWKVLSIILPINAFAFTTFLKSGGLETKDNYVREAWYSEKVKNHLHTVEFCALENSTCRIWLMKRK